MAARLNRLHQESVKQKIKASQLINTLQNHVDGKHELNPSQVDAAKYLLSLVVSKAPTQVQQEINGNINANVSFTVVGIEPQARDSE